MSGTLGEVMQRQIYYASTLRKANTESPIETLMMSAFLSYGRYTLVVGGDEPTGEGIFIMPQYKHGPYRADFLILVRGYEPAARVWPPTKEKKLILECDGEEFHSSKEQKEYDQKRDEYFKSHGFEVMRITGAQIYRIGHELAGIIYKDLTKDMAI